MPPPHWKTALATALCVAGCSQVCRPVFGQAPPTILKVDLENMVRYVYDVADPLKFATNPSVTTPITPTNFNTQMLISDIVAVNGQPAKGTQIFRENVLRLSPNPTPGQAIADITGNSTVLKWVILKPDGTLIGTLVGLGAPVAIVGGTGAFLGARGQSSSGVPSPPVRAGTAGDCNCLRGTSDITCRLLAHHGGKARQSRRGLDRESHRSRSHCSRCRSRPAVSN